MRQVQIALVGKLVGQPALPERFTSWFDAAKYRVNVSESPTLDTDRVLSPPSDGAVYVWVTLRHDTEARLYFATAKAGAAPLYSLREVPLDSGLDEVGAERLSQIVHLSVLALFEGQGEHERAQVARMLDEEPVANTVAKPPPPPVVPTRPPAAPPPTSLATTQPPAAPPPPAQAGQVQAPPDDVAPEFEVGLGYALSPRSDEGLWHGPALHAAVRFESGVVLELEGQGFLPHDEDVEAIRLRFWGIGMGVGAGWGVRWRSGWGVSGTFGPRVEVISYEPRESLTDEITLAEGETELRPEVGITGRLGVNGLRLGAGLFARVAYALDRTHYDVRTDTSPREIAVLSRFLPTVGLELTF